MPYVHTLLYKEDKVYFLLIKPDGQRYLPEIVEKCQAHGFFISKVCYTDQWQSLCSELYQQESQKQGETFLENLETYIWINKKLFGDSSLILVLDPEVFTEPAVTVQRIHELKIGIREDLIPLYSIPYAILVNVQQIDIEHHITKTKNYPPILKETGETIVPFFYGEGYLKSFYLNYVHCPDPDVDIFMRENAILERHGVYGKILPFKVFEKCVRYRTFSFAEYWNQESGAI